MSRVTFRTGVRAIKSDMDRIGEFAEGDAERLLRAMVADSNGDAIFNRSVSAAIVVSTPGPDHQVDVSADLFFAANSHYGFVASGFSGSYVNTGGAGYTATLYAVVERYRDVDARVYASGVPPVLATDPAADVAVLEKCSLVLLDDPATPPATEATSVSVDYIEVAKFRGDGSAYVAATDFDPNGILWDFPGVAAAVIAHAVSHTTGGDPIPSATPAARGIVEIQEFNTIRAAVTAVTPAAGSPLSVATTGDNNPTAKAAEISLSTGTGLTQSGGQLKVDFGAVAPAGHSHSAAVLHKVVKLLTDIASGSVTFSFGIAGVDNLVVDLFLRNGGVMHKLPSVHERTIGGSIVEVGPELRWTAGGDLIAYFPGVVARLSAPTASALGYGAVAKTVVSGDAGELIAIVSRTSTV